MGNAKKKLKKGFVYNPTAEELENFMSFLEDLQQEIRNSALKKKEYLTRKKSKKKTPKKKQKDYGIQELPF